MPNAITIYSFPWTGKRCAERFRWVKFEKFASSQQDSCAVTFNSFPFIYSRPSSRDTLEDLHETNRKIRRNPIERVTKIIETIIFRHESIPNRRPSVVNSANIYHFISSREEDPSHEERFPITASPRASLLPVEHIRTYIPIHICAALFPGIEFRPLVPTKASACPAVSRFPFFFGDTNGGPTKRSRASLIGQILWGFIDIRRG